ncbi:hypothetical protein OG320_05345 [Microbispora sp. NBC_01189]|uniref:hypothetical protein n=1 Tax=Microbispora sp. NBC_01189 TaxID=2903583 RepID=UPI002E11651B|nr:hypothetical protein OG320_05345 [Microbispora sp. NBC_01189]
MTPQHDLGPAAVLHDDVYRRLSEHGQRVITLIGGAHGRPGDRRWLTRAEEQQLRDAAIGIVALLIQVDQADGDVIDLATRRARRTAGGAG